MTKTQGALAARNPSTTAPPQTITPAFGWPMNELDVQLRPLGDFLDHLRGIVPAIVNEDDLHRYLACGLRQATGQLFDIFSLVSCWHYDRQKRSPMMSNRLDTISSYVARLLSPHAVPLI